MANPITALQAHGHEVIACMAQSLRFSADNPV